MVRKRKKRRDRKSKSPPPPPEWDRDSSDVATTHDPHRYVEIDPDNPNKSRVTKLKKAQTRTDKFARILLFTLIVGLCGYGLVVMGIGIFGSMGLALRNTNDTDEPTLDGVPESATERQKIDEPAVREILQNFLDTTGVEERAQWVRHSDSVLPLMKDWYERHPPERVEKFAFRSFSDGQFGEIPVITTQIVTDDDKTLAFLLVRTPQGPRIDWKMSVKYQPMDWDVFMRKRPSEPLPFSVRIRLSNIYKPPFADEQKFRAYEILLFPPVPDVPYLLGYARFGSETATNLEIALGFENTAAVILELRYPPDASDPKVVEITKLVRNTWIDP